MYRLTLFLLALFAFPVVSYSHLSPSDLEFDYHNFNYGSVMTKTQIETAPVGYIFDSAPAMDNDHLYLVLDGCSSSAECDQRLIDFAHDLVVSDVGCKQVYKYLGLRILKYWNNNLQIYVYSYSFVHSYTNYPAWLGQTVTTDLNGVKHYHLYVQNYSFNQTTQEIYNTVQTSLVNPRIDKYLGFIDYVCSVSYPNQCGYIEKYEFYKFWRDDFTFDEYRDSVGNDKYYVNADIPGFPGCFWGTYIETFFIIPRCVSKTQWKLRLCRRESNGTIWCTDESLQGDTTIWKFYGHPSFSEAPSVFIKDLYQGFLYKADFIQDETIYESAGQTYQGFSYWYAVATYQGNSYILKMYGSDPPCRDVQFDGFGVRNSGKGAREVGRGVRFRGGGGIVQTR